MAADSRRGSTLTTASALLIAFMAVLAPVQTQASPISYCFTGVISGGSTLDLGNGLIDLSGAAFTVSGTTLNDVDMVPGEDSLGVFAATSTYEFGALGAFTSDPGTDFYMQVANQFQNFGIDFVGLSQFRSGQLGFPGFTVGIANLAADPNTITSFGIASPIYTNAQTPRRLSNGAGQSLYLGFSLARPLQIDTVSAQPVPEPATLLLFGLGAAGAAAARRLRHRQRSNN